MFTFVEYVCGYLIHKKKIKMFVLPAISWMWYKPVAWGLFCCVCKHTLCVLVSLCTLLICMHNWAWKCALGTDFDDASFQFAIVAITFAHHTHGRNVLIQEVIDRSAATGSGSTLLPHTNFLPPNWSFARKINMAKIKKKLHE